MNYRKWTDSDKEFIKNNAEKMNDTELASRLSEITSSKISIAMIRTQRRKAGLTKPRGRQSKKNISLSSLTNSINN
jgi:hypothetical protein